MINWLVLDVARSWRISNTLENIGVAATTDWKKQSHYPFKHCHNCFIIIFIIIVITFIINIVVVASELRRQDY